jgi:hypothetical protein
MIWILLPEASACAGISDNEKSRIKKTGGTKAAGFSLLSPFFPKPFFYIYNLCPSPGLGRSFFS